MSMMIEKIKRALVEGCFIKKVIGKLDRELGVLSQFFVSKTSSVEAKKLIFMTYQNDYACNQKYIVKEILKQGLDWDIVFVVKNINKVALHFPEGVRLVKRNSYEFYKEAATAKFWIDNSINFFWENVPKKKEQILISTWHGSMGLKRAGKEDNKNQKWVEKSMRCDIDTDYCVSNSNFEDNVYKITHWPTRKILKYGHPRNDLLFEKDKSIVNDIREKVLKQLGIPNNVKIALYAPTFRDSHNLDCYDIDYQRLIDALRVKFDGQWVVLARHHFHLWNNNVARRSVENIDGVIRATDYDDMQELMLISDVGITDYSSWICDFVLTRKPGFIFATDLNEYNNERGLYYPLETTPFPVATNNDELMENVLSFDNNVYQMRIDEFLIDKGCVEDGKASYRVVEKIKEIMGEK